MTKSSWKYPLSDIVIGKAEEAAVLAVLQSRWLSMGPQTIALEEEFGRAMGAKYVLATSNGTTALHLALLALEIGPGDEVIVPALSFVATSNAVLYTGAKPVFADIESRDLPLIAPDDIARRITRRTKAIIVMHYAGYPCRMIEIQKLARKHNLHIIEDAAHCAGSKFGEGYCGTLGDAGCFSLFGNKNLPAGEGGFLITASTKIFEKAKRMRSHGMTTLSWDRNRGHASGYDVTELGFNYRMPELSAAVGREQLKRLSTSNAKRDTVFSRYLSRLGTLSSLRIPFSETRDKSPGSRHLMPVLLAAPENRAVFMQEMGRLGIQTSIHYTPIYQFTYYRSCPDFTGIHLERTEDFSRRVVTLPFHQGLSEADVDVICDGIERALSVAARGGEQPPGR